MEAERESLYKAIGYAKGEALEPFSKEVFTMLLFVMLCICMCNSFKLLSHN